ncbi:MAG: PHP domain-containing protein [Candidatus Woesearchaeota archaeon]
MIINLEESLVLKNQGYLALDPHVHSSHSYDVPESTRTIPESIILAQENHGLIKIITDHDTMSAHNYLSRKDVVRGVEIKIKPKKMRLIKTINPMHTLHINVYGLDDSQFEILENISRETGDFDLFIDYIRSEGLKYQYNHPFWHERKEKMNWKVIPEITKEYFDVVEVNAGRPKILNDLAIYLAQEYGKGITSSTDTHTGRLGHAMVLAKGNDFNEMWENIINRQMYIVRNDITAIGVVEEAARMIENIFDVKIKNNGSYTLDTGIMLLDALAKSIHTAKTNNMVGKIVYKGVGLFNNYFGRMLAEKLYIGKENKLGQEIKNNIMDVAFNNAVKYKVSEYT